MDIEIYDTRESKIGTVRNVPADTELRACRMVAEIKGYRWVGPAREGLGGGGGYAIDVDYYKRWHPDCPGYDSNVGLEMDAKRVLNGEADEFRGLIWLYKAEELPNEDWNDLVKDKQEA